MKQFFIFGKILLISMLFSLAVRNISMPTEHSFQLRAGNENQFNTHFEGGRDSIYSTQTDDKTISITVKQRINLSDVIGIAFFTLLAASFLSFCEHFKQSKASRSS